MSEPVPHPGIELHRRLRERGWTQEDLAWILKRPRPAISDICRGKRGISYRLAVELAQAFADTTPTYWRMLWMKFLLDQLERNPRRRKGRKRQCTDVPYIDTFGGGAC